MKLTLQYDAATKIVSLVSESGEVIEDVVSLSWDVSNSDYMIAVLKNIPLSKFSKSQIIDEADLEKVLITTQEYLREENDEEWGIP